MTAGTVVLDRDDMRRTLVRIAHEIVEKNPGGEGSSVSNPRDGSSLSNARDGSSHSNPDDADAGLALVGIHRRGAIIAQRLHALTSELLATELPLGFVDIAFYRDDLAIRPSAPIVHSTQLDFAVDGRTIVIVDDVLYTGRTVRAAIDEIFDYGRPARVQLATLVDRGHRELPIKPTFVGKNIATSTEQRVYVRVQELDGYDEVTVAPAPEPKRAAA